jgi:membrane-bound lytic murein transglycosylase B
MLHVYDQRPPFVRFEEREWGINQEASEIAGRPVPKVIVLACITPHASKDVVEKPAEEWLQQIRAKAVRGDFNPQWAEMFRMQYEEYLKGNELPREGTPVKTWQAITRAEMHMILGAGYTVVEDLAQVPDSGLNTIGLSGRYLRDLARNWIAEAKDKGINAKALADANAKIEQQQQTIDSMRLRLERLESDDDGSKRRKTPREAAA